MYYQDCLGRFCREYPDVRRQPARQTLSAAKHLPVAGLTPATNSANAVLLTTDSTGQGANVARTAFCSVGELNGAESTIARTIVSRF